MKSRQGLPSTSRGGKGHSIPAGIQTKGTEKGEPASLALRDPFLMLKGRQGVSCGQRASKHSSVRLPSCAAPQMGRLPMKKHICLRDGEGKSVCMHIHTEHARK